MGGPIPGNGTAGVRQRHLPYYFPTRADPLQAVAQGIAAGSADKRRVRVMLGLVAGGLETDPESVAFFHSAVVGCAVLQLAVTIPENFGRKLVRGIMLKDNVLADLSPQFWPIAAFVLVVIGMGLGFYRRTLG